MCKATRCVYCEKPIDPPSEPVVHVSGDEEEGTAESYVHFRCYARHERLAGDVSGGDS